MRLQIDITQDGSHGPGADTSDDAVTDGLTGQIVTGPVGDVQAFGDIQAGRFDNLGPLDGGDAQVASGVALPVISEQAFKTPIAIPQAGPPDGRLITVQLGSEIDVSLTGRDAQENSGTPDLIPRRSVPVNDPFQFDDVRTWDAQRCWLASSHLPTRTP